MEKKGYRLVPLMAAIYEEDIAEFCGPCDRLGINNSCTHPAVKPRDQARYAYLKFCDLASVNSHEGLINRDCFKASQDKDQEQG